MKSLKPITLCLVFQFIIIGVLAQSSEEKLSELVGENKNIGVVAAYSVEGKIVWQEAQGYACKEGNVKMELNTPMRIASIAKTFTAVAIMQLSEAGKLDINAPISQYLQNLPQDKQNISCKQLMAHTSGIPAYLNEKEIENQTHYRSLEEVMPVFINREMLSEPGKAYHYSSYGYVVLGRLIEVVSGMKYDEYMQAEVFAKAGMQNTWVESRKTPKPQSCLYTKKKKKTIWAKSNDLSNRVPAGGYTSCMADLLSFANALLDGKLVNQASLEEMLQAQAVEYDGNKYGLGWFLYGPAPHENIVIGHSGGQTGCTSQLMIVPKSKTASVVLSNTSRTYPEIVGLASFLIQEAEKQLPEKKE